MYCQDYPDLIDYVNANEGAGEMEIEDASSKKPAIFPEHLSEGVVAERLKAGELFYGKLNVNKLLPDQGTFRLWPSLKRRSEDHSFQV